MDRIKVEAWKRFHMVLVFVAAQMVTSNGNYSKSACHNEKTMELVCPHGHMVRILRAFYGVSYTGQCQFKEGDCKVTEKEHYPCIGKRRCPINLPSPRYFPVCKHKSTYFQADYQCIKASEVIDICSPVQEINAQTGYIKTPHYPLNYPNNRTCEVTILGRKTNQVFKIIALDVYLNVPTSHKNDTSSYDKLFIKDSRTQHTLSGNRWNETVFRSWAKNSSVNLKFISSSTHRLKGFWLYFEAIPLLPTPPPPSTTPTTSSSTSIHTTRPSGGKQDTYSQNVSDGKGGVVKEKTGGTKLPAAAIIGGFLGGLLFILAILVILLLVKRIREKKQLDAQRAEANARRSSSNSQHTQIQNNVVPSAPRKSPEINPQNRHIETLSMQSERYTTPLSQV